MTTVMDYINSQDNLHMSLTITPIQDDIKASLELQLSNSQALGKSKAAVSRDGSRGCARVDSTEREYGSASEIMMSMRDHLVGEGTCQWVSQ